MNTSAPSWFSRRNIRLFLFLPALLAAVPGQAKTPVASAAETDAALQQFIQAWTKEDLNAVVAAFAPDAIAFDPTPPGKFEHTAGIRTWVSDTFKALAQISINVSDVQIHTAGSVTWLTGHYVFQAKVEAMPIKDEGNLSMVWVKQTDGSYKISVFHADVPPPPPPEPAPLKK
jgi:ketosteroid isomerase-like protein